MNKAQIKAELRRSACEDENPLLDHRLSDRDMESLYQDFVALGEWLCEISVDDKRTFFLFVAEAL